MNVSSVRIVRRETTYDRRERLSTPRPFSEVLIVADGRHYCTRLFHTVDDSPHARAAQTQDFLRRQAAAGRTNN